MKVGAGHAIRDQVQSFPRDFVPPVKKTPKADVRNYRQEKGIEMSLGILLIIPGPLAATLKKHQGPAWKASIPPTTNLSPAQHHPRQSSETRTVGRHILILESSTIPAAIVLLVAVWFQVDPCHLLPAIFPSGAC